MTKRVLVFGEYGTRNGGENSFLAVAAALSRIGWEFHAAVPQDSEFADALVKLRIPIIDFCTQDHSGQRKTQAEIRNLIEEMIRERKPDLLHCNSLSTSRLVGPVAHQLGVPSLGYLRDILKLSQKAIADINGLDRIIAVSSATRDWHGQQGIELDKTFVVYNGVDSDCFFSIADSDSGAPDPVRSELGIGIEDPILLFVGQIGIRKGVDTLVEAFLNVAESFPDVHLLIAGQRHSQKQEAIEYEQRLRQQTDASVHKQQIHWLGVRSDVPELMRAASLLVHPARQEPLGRVLLEAAASGLPIVTTNVGGTPEILSGPNLASLMVPPNDAGQLSRKILELLSNPRRMGEVGMSLQDVASRLFSIQSCAEQLNVHYRQLLGQ